MTLPDLPYREDIYGHVFMDAWRGEPHPYYLRRDDGHVEEGPPVLDGELGDPPDRHSEVLSRAHGRVLDLGCGPGRHVCHLQGLGLEVVGTDASPLAVAVARERGAKDVRVMPIEELSFAPESFDTAAFFSGTIGIGCDAGGLAARLARLGGVMRPGGTLIAQVRDPEATDNPAHTSFHEMRRREGRYPGEMGLRLEYRGHASEWWHFTLVGPELMREAGEGSGWEWVELLFEPADGFALLRWSE